MRVLLSLILILFVCNHLHAQGTPADNLKSKMPEDWYLAINEVVTDKNNRFYTLLENVPWELLHADTTVHFVTDDLIKAGHKSLYLHNNKMVVLYLPDSRSFHVDLTKLNGQRFKSVWYSPRTGKKWVGGYYLSNDCQLIVPPGDDETWSWIVLIGNSPK